MKTRTETRAGVSNTYNCQLRKARRNSVLRFRLGCLVKKGRRGCLPVSAGVVIFVVMPWPLLQTRE
ncbi:hypothetical protein ACFPRL_28720 [Pseudoclavibacter helvolus]